MNCTPSALEDLSTYKTNKKSHLSIFKEVRDHDDDPGVLLPDHPPEAVEGSLHGALGGDVGARRPEAVHVVGVEVVVLAARGGRAGATLGAEADAGVIIWIGK